MALEEDRLSNLADNLLSCEILSKLSLQDAVRSSILSTRWHSLWTKIPHLHVYHEFFAWICPVTCSETITCKYTDIIDNILQQHSAPLTSFRFNPHHGCKINTEKIEEWIECIRAKGAKEISISGTIQVPTTLFACQTLTALELGYLHFSEIPESCLGFPCLVSCSLRFVIAHTEKNIIENFIAICPQLQILRLNQCFGLGNLKLCAQNLKYLWLIYCSFQTLIVDCPQLMKLMVSGCQFFGVTERNNCSGLSLFKVKCPASLYDVNVSELWLLESLLAAKTVRKISVGKCKLPCVSGFLNMLSNFPNLEKLVISECIVEERNMAAGKEMGIASDINFLNLKEVFVGIRIPGNEEAMLNFLLGHASSLKIMTINILGICVDVRSQVLDLKKASTEVEIRILRSKGITDIIKNHQRGLDNYYVKFA